MNIHTEPGAKIRYAYTSTGFLSDQEGAKKHLKRGQVYTVAQIDVHSSISYVELREIPGITFNTVMFSNVRKGK